MPEEPYLYPFLSGREYLQLVGRLRELPERLLTDKIDGFLRLFNLSAAADQSIGSYSKGMRQKIVISAALLHDPAVVIFDEPETGLDVATTLMLRHLVRTLAARGKAILYSSHILEVVERVCDRVIVLHKGNVVADDSIARLRRAVVEHLARGRVLAAGHSRRSRIAGARSRRPGGDGILTCDARTRAPTCC